MSFPCKFCKITIFQAKDGSKLYYEDENRTILHDCPELKKKKGQTTLPSTGPTLAGLETRIEILEENQERKINYLENKLQNLQNDFDEFKLHSKR